MQNCVPSSKEAPLAKLMKSVPPAEVRVTLRLDTDREYFPQTAASAGTNEAKDAGTSQSYTVG